MTTTTKQLDICRIMEVWKHHVEQVKRLQNTCLLLMQHPDTTPAQLVEAHYALKEVMRAHREARPKVRAVWPCWMKFPDIEERIDGRRTE